MSNTKYNQSHKDVLDKMLLDNPIVKPGKMFGYPGYYVGGKLFACVYENGVGIKIPESMANELLEREEIVHFQPYGRKKMRKWIQINRQNSEDYRQGKGIFEASIMYVSKIAGLEP